MEYPNAFNSFGMKAFNYRGFSIEILAIPRTGFRYSLSDKYMNISESNEKFDSEMEAIKEAKKIIDKTVKEGHDTVPFE